MAISRNEATLGWSAQEGGGIFRGVKLLELGAGAAGPVATRYFAEQGACVIRIESAKRPDFLRLLHLTPENRNDPNILELAPMFVLMNPNKASLTLNLKDPKAVELLRKLVSWADVVSENFAPGVMERWGLAPAPLREIKNDLIVVSGCLFGQTGPQRSYPGFGGQGSAIAGFNHLAGHPEREAHGPYATITDSVAPRYVAVATAAALLEKRRSGRGQTIDVSQIETGVYSLSQVVVRYSANGESEVRRENRDEFAAPHGVFPCRGEDRWIAIAIRCDESWKRLVASMDFPGWAAGEAYSTVAGRLEACDAIEANLAEWTRGFERYELMEKLQAEGIEAGVVQDVADLANDPQLAHRGHFQQLEHEYLGELAFERCGFRIQGEPGGYETPGPKLGQHTRSILRDVLGLDDEKIDTLMEEGVLT